MKDRGAATQTASWPVPVRRVVVVDLGLAEDQRAVDDEHVIEHRAE